jgi:hypothetical protein
MQRAHGSPPARFADLADCAGKARVHPARLKRFQADVEWLAAALNSPDTKQRDKLIEHIRRLIAGVIVRSDPAGKPGAFQIELEGYLAELTQLTPTAPKGGGLLVAGGRYRHSHLIAHLFFKLLIVHYFLSFHIAKTSTLTALLAGGSGDETGKGGTRCLGQGAA